MCYDMCYCVGCVMYVGIHVTLLQVADLQTKAYEFGCWYPVNSPNQRITPNTSILDQMIGVCKLC